MKTRVWQTCLLLTLAIFSAKSAVLASNDAQAGWAEVDITPPLGLSMGGRGPTDVEGTNVFDPLFAQVLYLKDRHGTGFVLISMDLVSIPHELSDRVRLDMVHELGVNWNLVVLNASHVHSGPQTIHTLLAGQGPLPKNEADYFDMVEQTLVDAARRAAQNLEPVKVEVFEGKSQVAINRRGHDSDGKPAMKPNPRGPIAEKLWVLKLTPEQGEPPIIVFSYACHAVIVYEFAPASISADFPGVTRNVLHDKLGGARVQFVQGLAGDVRPRVLADLPNNIFRLPRPDDVQQAGRDLAADVQAALKSRPRKLKLNLAGAADRPFLARGTLPPKAFEALFQNPRNKPQEDAAKYWLDCYQTGIGFSKGDPWPTGLLRLADNQWVFFTAGEPCVEWGPKVAQWLKPRNVVLWGYCQEGMSYLPTDEMLPEGGYEVLDSNKWRASSPAPLAAGVNESIRRSLMRQLAAIEQSQ
ncbi:MAG: hypothetical protein C5B50_15430 [Verrucomicrobia bacterium]|nr:MAG: hypothetical protein C5B50_15430 [Verrucomicrobiota bacterium]